MHSIFILIIISCASIATHLVDPDGHLALDLAPDRLVGRHRVGAVDRGELFERGNRAGIFGDGGVRDSFDRVGGFVLAGEPDKAGPLAASKRLDRRVDAVADRETGSTDEGRHGGRVLREVGNGGEGVGVREPGRGEASDVAGERTESDDSRGEFGFLVRVAEPAELVEPCDARRGDIARGRATAPLVHFIVARGIVCVRLDDHKDLGVVDFVLTGSDLVSHRKEEADKTGNDRIGEPSDAVHKGSDPRDDPPDVGEERAEDRDSGQDGAEEHVRHRGDNVGGALESVRSRGVGGLNDVDRPTGHDKARDKGELVDGGNTDIAGRLVGGVILGGVATDTAPEGDDIVERREEGLWYISESSTIEDIYV